jgi:hypothetical protein
MFEFVRAQPMSMLDYLDHYLADPYWCHATDVVPMVAATLPEAWPLWAEEALHDERVLSHVIQSLGRWRAFRKFNRQRVENPRATLRSHLAAFIIDIQSIPEARLRLSDVPDTDIEALATTLTARLRRFGVDVKGVDSCVLPSKTAHLLVLPLVPAYDLYIIRDRTLCRLAPNAWDMESYILMCWWVLQRFQEEGTLQEARDQVARYMLGEPMARTRPLPRPQLGHWLLHSMDSIVAEYTLIQMGRTVENEYLLRWAAPATA